MIPTSPDEPCEPTAGRIVNERNRYFTGKALTARDFTDEQSYHISRHRLHNRLLHGWGVVCGLGVEQNPNPECKDVLIVRKGIAIDGFGRELIVGHDYYLRLPVPPTPTAPDLGVVSTPLGEAEIEPSPYVLCLFYGLDPFEYVPALYTEQTCDPGLTVPGRVRESPRLVFVSQEWFNKKVPGCWKTDDGPTPQTPESDEEAPWTDCSTWTSDDSGCMQMNTLCGGMVPLAVVSLDPFKIDTEGRRNLIVDPCRSLTHIAWFNWQHGGTVPLDSVEDQGLVVEFDRRVRVRKGNRTGINAFTFLAEYRTHGHWKALQYEVVPYLDDGRTRAVYRIHPKYFLQKDHCRRVLGKMVRVTLKCDFIPDQNGLAVDGNFLNGRRPTGDGNPGGTFESWFQVGKHWPRQIAQSSQATTNPILAEEAEG